MNHLQRRQLQLAISLLLRHSGVDYNNSLQTRLAEQWIEATLDSIEFGRELPARPAMLMDSPQ